ncbi:hypothetical protein CYMTET_36239, partial [Cymbomonas tetramitiformis]
YISGGAFLAEDAVLTLRGCLVTENIANITYGGAAFVQDSHLLVEDSELGFNRAESGGALYMDGTASKLSLANATLHDNEASFCGGAVYATNGASVMATHTQLAWNVAAIYGGGVALYRAVMAMHGGALLGNTAEEGGWRP